MSENAGPTEETARIAAEVGEAMGNDDAGRQKRIDAAQEELRIAHKAREEAERWVIIAEIALMELRQSEDEIDRLRLAYFRARVAGNQEEEHRAHVRVMAAYYRQHGGHSTWDEKQRREIEEEAAKGETP